ncbi:hypothetical protein BXO88_08220 [Oribacterium sp. C9]|uniref:efflux RND transporter permease subunit n=1 Tax=Oribacterium sp. C9 TaxID=1943579 RepID=UPI000990235A|nr:efflux RND transporter permease subunit [Oribacterium sp. C9]OON86254.1 hypothetical protein BXO88_08220 [Oribacterium sp. C9]
MYECPSCGGDLRFDIPSQMLRCEHCESTFDPYSVERDQDAEERTLELNKDEVTGRDSGEASAEITEQKTAGDMDPQDAGEKNRGLQVTIFTCRSCGAEISSTNLSAAGFCSYCGQPAVFSSRVSNERRPEKIIPFKIDKSTCKEMFTARMKGALYAPKDLADPEALSGFVGIYMPYWVYGFSVGPQAVIPVSRTKTQGRYEITDKYNLTMDIDGKFDGIAFDASSSFNDHIAEVIAPYDAKDMIEFTPSFLCGFYADVPDVPSITYKDDAEVYVLKHTFESIDKECKKKGFDRDSLGNVSSAEGMVNLKYEGEKEAMLPVWFLTYRKGDRICYSVMNGVTGKLSADIPVDFKKFYITSFLLSIPIFIMLNMQFTVQPKAVLIFSLIMALITGILYMIEIDKIEKKEDPREDQGYVAARCNGAFKSGEKVKVNAYNDFKDKTAAKKESHLGGCSSVLGYLFIAYWGLEIILGAAFIIMEYWFIIVSLLFIAGIILLVIYMLDSKNAEKAREKGNKKEAKKYSYREMMGVILGLVTAVVVLIWNPVEDIIFYGASTAVFAGIVYTITGIIQKYNILSTHPIPEYFDREGGNIHA